MFILNKDFSYPFHFGTARLYTRKTEVDYCQSNVCLLDTNDKLYQINYLNNQIRDLFFSLNNLSYKLKEINYKENTIRFNDSSLDLKTKAIPAVVFNRNEFLSFFETIKINNLDYLYIDVPGSLRATQFHYKDVELYLKTKEEVSCTDLHLYMIDTYYDNKLEGTLFNFIYMIFKDTQYDYIVVLNSVLRDFFLGCRKQELTKVSNEILSFHYNLDCIL